MALPITDKLRQYGMICFGVCASQLGVHELDNSKVLIFVNIVQEDGKTKHVIKHLPYGEAIEDLKVFKQWFVLNNIATKLKTSLKMSKQMGAYTVINMVVDTANLKFVKPSNADNVDIYHTISAASRHILDK